MTGYSTVAALKIEPKNKKENMNSLSMILSITKT